MRSSNLEKLVTGRGGRCNLNADVTEKAAAGARRAGDAIPNLAASKTVANEAVIAGELIFRTPPRGSAGDGPDTGGASSEPEQTGPLYTGSSEGVFPVRSHPHKVKGGSEPGRSIVLTDDGIARDPRGGCNEYDEHERSDITGGTYSAVGFWSELRKRTGVGGGAASSSYGASRSSILVRNSC